MAFHSKRFSYLRTGFNQTLTFFTMLWARWFAPAPAKPVTDVLYADKHLAAAIGLEEAIIVTRLLAWQHYNEAKQKHATHKHEGKWYTYNSVEDWVIDFGGAFKATTLGRYLRKLEDMKLLKSAQLKKAHCDMRKWYHVDEKALKLVANDRVNLTQPSCQIDKMIVSKRHTTISTKQAIIPNLQGNKTTSITARAQNADVDVSEVGSTGEHFLQSTEGADSTSTFEATAHTSDAPENPLPVAQGFPLPKLVAVLVDKHKLSPLTAVQYLEKYGVEHCERVAAVAIGGHTPAGLWRTSLDKGDYKHVSSDTPRVAGKIDEFIIK